MTKCSTQRTSFIQYLSLSQNAKCFGLYLRFNFLDCVEWFNYSKASSWVHNFKCVWYHKLSICILWKKGGDRNVHQYVESIKSRKTNESLCKYFCVLCKWTSLFLLEKFCANKFLLSPFKDDGDDFKEGWKFSEWILSSCFFKMKMTNGHFCI